MTKTNFEFSDSLNSSSRYNDKEFEDVDYSINITINNKHVSDKDFKSIITHSNAIKEIVKEYSSERIETTKEE